MGHRHAGWTRLASPSHLLTALFFFRRQLGVWHHTRHDRSPEKKGREKSCENGSAPHGYKLTLSCRSGFEQINHYTSDADPGLKFHAISGMKRKSEGNSKLSSNVLWFWNFPKSLCVWANPSAYSWFRNPTLGAISVAGVVGQGELGSETGSPRARVDRDCQGSCTRNRIRRELLPNATNGTTALRHRDLRRAQTEFVIRGSFFASAA